MALGSEDLKRAYLLVRVTHIDEDKNDWRGITEKIRKVTGVIGADWVSGLDDTNDPYQIIVPVVTEIGKLPALVGEIKALTFSPNKVEKVKEVRVKGHNPDPTKDNVWG